MMGLGPEEMGASASMCKCAICSHVWTAHMCRIMSLTCLHVIIKPSVCQSQYALGLPLGLTYFVNTFCFFMTQS